MICRAVGAVLVWLAPVIHALSISAACGNPSTCLGQTCVCREVPLQAGQTVCSSCRSSMVSMAAWWSWRSTVTHAHARWRAPYSER